MRENIFEIGLGKDFRCGTEVVIYKRKTDKLDFSSAPPHTKTFSLSNWPSLPITVKVAASLQGGPVHPL